MAARPLTEAVQQAEEAISGGNYRSAVETCRRVLGQFPEFATAHRLLGEALFEEGDVSGAERAFAEALQRDPQSSDAYSGLSRIAEGRGDQDSAIAYAQVAWEIMPQRADLRDRVAALSEQLYGTGGRLHLTRAALTSLHFRSGRWSRAAAEAAAVLGEHPDRVDVQLRMAESLWRRGSLTAAGNACRSVLMSSPSAVMALLMLADVERRQNNQESAARHLDQARKIDPDGVRAADLVTIGSADLAEFMLQVVMPELDEATEVIAEIERPRIAPAPDFIWPEAPSEAARGSAEGSSAEIQRVAQAAVDADDSGYDVSLPDDAEIDAARPPAQAEPGFTSMLRSLEGEGLQPFRLSGESDDETVDAFEPAEDEAPDDSVFSLVSDEEIEAARPPVDAPHGFTTLLNSLDNTGLEPFQVEGNSADTEAERQARSSTEVTDELKAELPTEVTDEVETDQSSSSAAPAPQGDDLSALTAGWDDIDAEIQRAIPTENSWKGYTGQLRELDETGLTPFSVEGEVSADPIASAQSDEAASEPDLDPYEGDLSFLNEVGLEDAPALQGEADTLEMDSDLTEGWNMIDDEIENAIPSDPVSGYTDELDALNLSGVEPFAVEDNPAETASDDDEVVETTSAAAIKDVVPSDLVADIDLWTFDEDANQAAAETAATSAIDETAGSDSSETEVELVAEQVDVIMPFDISEFEQPEIAAEQVNGDELEVDTLETESFAIDNEPAADPAMSSASEVDSDDVDFVGASEATTEDIALGLNGWSGSSDASPFDASTNASGEHPAHAVEVAASYNVRSTIQHLGVDSAMFARVREAKARLVESGQIQGDQLLPGVEPPGPTLDDLEQIAAENPDDAGSRRQFAAALVDSDEHGRAIAEYHAMFKKLMPFEDDDVENVSRVAEHEEHAVKGNRLLGAIHRRAGNFEVSANHYRQSLIAHRDRARKEA